MNTNNYIAKGEGADRYEKVPVRVYGKPSEAVKAVAREIADLIRSNAAKSENACWGWPPARLPSNCTRNWCGCTRRRGCRSRTW